MKNHIRCLLGIHCTKVSCDVTPSAVLYYHSNEHYPVTETLCIIMHTNNVNTVKVNYKESVVQ